MNSTTKISFFTYYYVRKVLLKHSKDLQDILDQSTGFCPNSSGNLQELLGSLYLEDILEQLLRSSDARIPPSEIGKCIFRDILGQLLQRLYVEENEISIKIQQLETLCLSHQQFVVKNLTHTKEMLNIQQQIFWLLGFKRIEIKIAEIVDALNQLSKYSSNYLGAKITVNNWESNRYNVDWLNNFSIDGSAKFAFSGTNAEAENFVQLQWIHKWVTAFVHQNTKTFRDFPQTIEQKKLGEVKKGLLLTRLGAYSAWLNVDTKPAFS